MHLLLLEDEGYRKSLLEMSVQRPIRTEEIY